MYDQIDKYFVEFSFVYSVFVLQLALEVFVKQGMRVKTSPLYEHKHFPCIT
jgi:hypothetical protein